MYYLLDTCIGQGRYVDVVLYGVYVRHCVSNWSPPPHMVRYTGYRSGLNLSVPFWTSPTCKMGNYFP